MTASVTIPEIRNYRIEPDGFYFIDRTPVAGPSLDRWDSLEATSIRSFVILPAFP